MNKHALIRKRLAGLPSVYIRILDIENEIRCAKKYYIKQRELASKKYCNCLPAISDKIKEAICSLDKYKKHYLGDLNVELRNFIKLMQWSGAASSGIFCSSAGVYTSREWNADYREFSREMVEEDARFASHVYNKIGDIARLLSFDVGGVELCKKCREKRRLRSTAKQLLVKQGWPIQKTTDDIIEIKSIQLLTKRKIRKS